MLKKRLVQVLAIGPLLVVLTGCESMPGDRRTQGAVIGGAAGAATGAILGGPEHRGVGALLGGILGAGGGYVIAARTDRIEEQDQTAAATAARRAQERPATAADARQATTADINNDGFVTLDEVVAMQEARFSDAEMVRRMEATDQIFELTPEQEQYLTERGVSRNVVAQMREVNRDLLFQDRQDVISREPVLN